MRYSDEDREKIINAFLDWCERIGYSDPNNPIQIDVVAGLPIGVKRAVQYIRFDSLTTGKQNSTME